MTVPAETAAIAAAPLDQLIRSDLDADGRYAAFTGWVENLGLTLYPAQDEAVLELVTGANVVLATPTGSGKSLVAVAAHFFARATGQRSVYTAPIKALVSEKFFALCAVFGSEQVGMITGDAAVNPDAPIICCTAEILANIALRTGPATDLGVVIMDEFHFFADPDRGWAWQVPLLELTRAQFLLMSATLGDVTDLVADLAGRTGRESVVVSADERPVPLHHYYALTPLHETIADLLAGGQAPIYIVHFTQAAALDHAQALTSVIVASRAGSPRRSASSGSPPDSARRCPGCCATGWACTMPGCCRSTGGWSNNSPSAGCSR
jgi:superfamily II RNA helicase